MRGSTLLRQPTPYTKHQPISCYYYQLEYLTYTKLKRDRNNVEGKKEPFTKKVLLYTAVKDRH